MIKTNRKRRVGEVISDKMLKTVIVRIVTSSKHPKYNKVLKHANKFKAHDENGVAKMGDTVLIEETRPISKDKRWRIVEVLKKGQAVDLAVIDEPSSGSEERAAK